MQRCPSTTPHTPAWRTVPGKNKCVRLRSHTALAHGASVVPIILREDGLIMQTPPHSIKDIKGAPLGSSQSYGVYPHLTSPKGRGTSFSSLRGEKGWG